MQKLGTNVWQIWPKKQKYKSDLMHNSEYQLCRVFVPNDLVEKNIKSRRLASKRFLELDPYKHNFGEQDITDAL